jgi:hypothetical protein
LPHTWRVDGRPWSERNQEAFSGLHNFGKRVLMIMDEASMIPDPIWRACDGTLNDAASRRRERPTVPTDSRKQYPGLIVMLANNSLGRPPYAGVEQVGPDRYVLAENTPPSRVSGISPAMVASALRRDG